MREFCLTLQKRNNVLYTLMKLLDQEKTSLLAANKKDLENYQGDDVAMYDRLKIDDNKIKGMILSLEQLASHPDPIGKVRYNFVHDNGLKIVDKTVPFGTVFIIYESRPDVTVEAAGIAFKSGNKILLKGGKESKKSNLKIMDLWHRSLIQNNIPTEGIKYLDFNREQAQEFLKNPSQRVDLIVPRGGEKLISFVKQYATCPVIVSGRGNNFIYVDSEADTEMALRIIVNGKVTKISACNAVDKVLIHEKLPHKDVFIKNLIEALSEYDVELLGDAYTTTFKKVSAYDNENIWYEEFLDYKMVMGKVHSMDEAIVKINRYGGGHSASIITQNEEHANVFMDLVDSASVYQNSSTRFTDGGQFGLGGELAISTDKLHQRGPMGLQHLVTNKWYVYGNGQIR